VLKYGGLDETAARSLATAGGGGTVEIPTGVTVTLTGALSGSGDLAKIGAGELRVTGGGGGMTGGISVTEGALSIASVGNGVGKTVTVGTPTTPATLRYTGGNVRDERGFAVGSAGGTVEITNARSSWTMTGAADLGAG